MRLQVVSENVWLYPDSPANGNDGAVALHAARGGMICFQILTDATLDASTPLKAGWTNAFGVRPTLYQLMPVCVDRNSGKDVLTGSYEDVADFVTRKAPFYVFDAMREPEDGMLNAGRLAFFVRLEADSLCAAGEHNITLSIDVGGEKAALEIRLMVHKTVIAPVDQARFGMVNWLKIPEMCQQHNVSPEDSRFDEILDAYLANQIELRNTQLQLPSGEPLRDAGGRVIDFDFSLAARVGNAALKRGFQYVMGGFVARFEVWNEETHYLLWDRGVSVASHEGYRQLKLYFTRAEECMRKNGWQGRYMQTLVDEPQFPNSDHYRILSSICRKFLPGVAIHDPVESTRLDGALEIWDVKQAVYEKYFDEYQALQELGEEMWLYTCGFPAGSMMNRVMDLPLTASRLPMWLCRLYGCKGFLHWGYNVHSQSPFEITSYRPDPKNDAVSYPAGNAHIVYPGENGPLYSVRAHLQRAGAEDYELLDMLYEKDSARAREIVLSVCRNFSDYTFDGNDIDAARNALLAALDD